MIDKGSVLEFKVGTCAQFIQVLDYIESGLEESRFETHRISIKRADWKATLFQLREMEVKRP